MTQVFTSIRRTVAALLWLCLSATAAPAAQLAGTDCPGSEVRIVVIGDSLADGLWGSLYRSFARCQTIEVVRLTEVSDGLARTSAEDWFGRYAGVTGAAGASARGKTEIVVVQIGANDITTIRDGATRLSFGSEDWNVAYSARVAQLSHSLAGSAAQVFWFGLPVVGNANLEGPYRAISALQERAATEAGAAFVDIHDATKFGTGTFAMNGEIDGRLRQLRATDQVHFTKAGYDAVAAQIGAPLSRLIHERDRRAALKDVTLQ